MGEFPAIGAFHPAEMAATHMPASDRNASPAEELREPGHRSGRASCLVEGKATAGAKEECADRRWPTPDYLSVNYLTPPAANMPAAARRFQIKLGRELHERVPVLPIVPAAGQLQPLWVGSE
jgi:hypothetical protein